MGLESDTDTKDDGAHGALSCSRQFSNTLHASSPAPLLRGGHWTRPHGERRKQRSAAGLLGTRGDSNAGSSTRSPQSQWHTPCFVGQVGWSPLCLFQLCCLSQSRSPPPPRVSVSPSMKGSHHCVLQEVVRRGARRPHRRASLGSTTFWRLRRLDPCPLTSTRWMPPGRTQVPMAPPPFHAGLGREGLTISLAPRHVQSGRTWEEEGGCGGRGGLCLLSQLAVLALSPTRKEPTPPTAVLLPALSNHPLAANMDLGAPSGERPLPPQHSQPSCLASCWWGSSNLGGTRGFPAHVVLPLAAVATAVSSARSTPPALLYPLKLCFPSIPSSTRLAIVKPPKSARGPPSLGLTVPPKTTQHRGEVR